MAAVIASSSNVSFPQMSTKYIPVVKKPVMVMVKNDHIAVEDQIKLIDAGIVYPACSKGYMQYLGEDTAIMSAKHVYVPNVGNKLLDIIHDQPMSTGNPLAFENASDMCLVITPPIAGFDYDKFANGNVLYGKHYGCFDEDVIDEPVTACPGYLPEYFVENARHVQALAINAIAQVTRGNHQFEVVGAKLNPLSSGMGNIVMYVKFPMGCPFNTQSYFPIYGTNMKVRVVPKPFITKNSTTKLYNIEVTVNVSNSDDRLFQTMYNYAGILMERDFHCKLKHVRTNKCDGTITIAGHSLKPIELSTQFQKAIKRSIVHTFLDNNYMVSDVTYKTFENY